MDTIGLDLHQRESQLCILTDDGEVFERRIVTSPARFTAVLRCRPRARILVEASTESEWVARHLEALGHADVVTQFASAHQVEPYLGRTPREYSSGERQHRGRISKTGSPRMRSLLVEAAWRVLRTTDPAAAPLRAWAEGIAQRRGRSIAAVALARRLAGMLYAMWRDGKDYRVPRPAAGAVA